MNFQLQTFQLYNKSLKDWSLGKQLILFPSNLNVSLGSTLGKKQTTLILLMNVERYSSSLLSKSYNNKTVLLKPKKSVCKSIMAKVNHSRRSFHSNICKVCQGVKCIFIIITAELYCMQQSTMGKKICLSTCMHPRNFGSNATALYVCPPLHLAAPQGNQWEMSHGSL